MAKVAVYNMSGSKVSDIELSDDIFAVDINEHVVHQSVVQYLANQRQGTQSAKTRSEVRGGGRKPWRQKGTGRARQGSTRSPQWTGGGVVFAPKPRDYSFKLNKKVKRLAMKSALTSRVMDGKLVVIDKLELEAPKTKDMVKVFDSLKANDLMDKKALVVLDNGCRNVVLSTRNIPNVKTADVNTINVYDILKYDTFVATQDAINRIQEVYV